MGRGLIHSGTTLLVMSEIAFTSTLGHEHKDELERLLFFNGNQARVSDAVSHVAQRYGVPRITTAGERLRIEIESPVEAQTLFVLHQTPAEVALVGVLVYTRQHDAFVVLFVAVHEDFTARGAMADLRLLLRMTDQLRAIGRRVKGVGSVLMFLGRPTPVRLAVDRPPLAGGRR